MQPVPSAGKQLRFAWVYLAPDWSKKRLYSDGRGRFVCVVFCKTPKFQLSKCLALHIFILFITDVSSCIQVQKAFMQRNSEKQTWNGENWRN